MSWRQSLELELEVVVADALDGGPATPSGAAAAERNMRAVLDRWMGEGRIPGAAGYTLSVTGGAGLSIELRFLEQTRAEGVHLDLRTEST